MLFAAGLGTRLAPLTDRLPKALVPVAGVPLLERVSRRLVAAGVDRLIINTHAFPQAVEGFVAGRGGFGVQVLFSPEPGAPLETGGGLLNARALFRGDRPAFLHNVDVLTDLPLGALYESHGAAAALATLAVHERRASRYLLFDEEGLVGHEAPAAGRRVQVRPGRGVVQRLAFCGVHVVSPGLLAQITERGAFPIVDVYLRLAAAGAPIRPFRVDGCNWMDVGTPARLGAAEAAAAAGRV
ncbi:MAG: sugar phosphate nucleotidyltransferase [Candidatus Latescibacterota bacterium]